MKTLNLRVLLVAIIGVLSASCFPTYELPSQSKLLNTATYAGVSIQKPVTPPLIADLKVSDDKIRYNEFPSKSLLKTDFSNILNTAVKNALEVNGNADVLIGLEYQVKTNDDGEIETITITGYPAKYTNFRHPDESVWLDGNTIINSSLDNTDKNN